MGVVHRFTGTENRMDWQGVPEKPIDPSSTRGVTGKVLIGPQDEALNFHVRYFRVEPGGHSSLERHPHDHGVYILHGRADVRIGAEEANVGPGDVVYVPGGEVHQFSAAGDEPLGFLCVVPADR